MSIRQKKYRFQSAIYTDSNGNQKSIPNGVFLVAELDLVEIEVADNQYIPLQKAAFEKMKREGNVTPVS